MLCGTPVLVNGLSEVLTGHVRRSSAGLYYEGYPEFIEAARWLLEDGRLRSRMGHNGAEYVKRNYQVVVDGVRGRVLYGKAPGNVFYRAAALVVGMALGNLTLVNGTLLMTRILSEDADGEVLALFLVPIGLGLALIAGGYRAFRYGEEVEEIQKGAKKAALAEDKGLRGRFESGLNIIEELSELME